MANSEVAIQRGDTSIVVTDRGGDGPPMVLLHGLAGSARELLPTADALTDRFRVLLVDQRGHGRSTRRSADLSRDAYVGDVVAVIEQLLAGQPVRLVGQSMGAHTAFLGDRPLTDAWVNDLEPTAEGLRPRFDPDIMQTAIAAVQEDRWTEWESLTVPALAVFAEHGMFTTEQKDELIHRRPATRRADLSAASHDAHLDAFEGWIGILNAYLDEDLD